MDGLTHALTGSLVADALPFTRKLGRRAQIVAIAAGMAPDLDLVVGFIAKFPPTAFSFQGMLDERYHRTFTHSFFYTALAAVVLGFAIRGVFHARGRWWQWALLLCAAFFSHIILDITNIWDVYCWLPFSRRPEAWCLMPLQDLFFTGLLVLMFVVNHILYDPYHQPGVDAPLSPPWRERSAKIMSWLGSVSLRAWIVVALLVARVWMTGMWVFKYPEVLS